MGATAKISIQELRSRTTAVLRRVEAGERIGVTKRGRVVAVIEPTGDALDAAPDSVYRALRRLIASRTPGLRHLAASAAREDFERISRKIARKISYKNWREMDRSLKGDRFGLSR